MEVLQGVDSGGTPRVYSRGTPGYIVEAEFREFELCLKFETQLKYGWFHLRWFSVFRVFEPIFSGLAMRFKFFKFCVCCLLYILFFLKNIDNLFIYFVRFLSERTFMKIFR